MILVDTSVWVTHLVRGDAWLRHHLERGDVATHAFVIGELACGTLRNRREVLSLLQALPSVPVVDGAEFLHFVESRSLAGLGLGFVDVHLLASAALARVSLWTTDKRLAAVADRLRLSPTASP